LAKKEIIMLYLYEDECGILVLIIILKGVKAFKTRYVQNLLQNTLIYPFGRLQDIGLKQK